LALSQFVPKISNAPAVNLERAIEPQTPDICYSCAWEGYDPKVRTDLIEFYRQYLPTDSLLFGDSRYVLWRSTGTPSCDVLELYRKEASSNVSSFRRYMAAAVLGFAARECGRDTAPFLTKAADAAAETGLAAESKILQMIALRQSPIFGDVEIRGSLKALPGSVTLILGESFIPLTPGMRVGVQVDRVTRDWISAQLRWIPNDEAVRGPLLDYHEGAMVKQIQEAADINVFPLAGTLVFKKGSKWYAPDENGVFRFEVLEDKLRYPTAHLDGSGGFIEDTHGISSLVAPALERHMDLVVGCGDSEGKAKAAYYLAARGINVFVPGDRYIDELVGYDAPGLILGCAPIHRRGENAVIGSQPVRFSFAETIVVEDTKKSFPIQYYDAPARYFRALARRVPLKLEFVNVDAEGQIERVLERATELTGSAVAVRVMTQSEDLALRKWLKLSPAHRAVLLHSALYPYAQPLFRDFPLQITFGDPHPRFE